MSPGGVDPVQTRRRLLFVGALVVAWTSFSAYPLLYAIREFCAPNDFTPDYVTAAAWVHQGTLGHLPAVLANATANAYAATLGARDVYLLGPYYVHPPSALLVTLPLVPLGYLGAVLVWQLGSLVLLGVLAWLLAPIAEEAGLRLPRPLLIVLLILWSPSLTNIELGQWSIILATALAAGHRAWERGARRRGAAWMGVATALKLTPVILLPYLFLRDRRAAARFVVVAGAIAAASLPIGGLAAWQALLRESGPNTTAWQTWWHNTLSLNGFWSRLLTGGLFATPWIHAPRVARVALAASGGGLLVIAAWATRAVARAAGLAGVANPAARQREGCVLALWYVLVVVLNPLAWPHYALLLLLPMALAARAAVAQGRRWAHTLVAVALLLLTIPKEILCLLGGQRPFTPPRSLFLSIPLYAALLIFAAAAAGALGRRQAGSIAGSSEAPARG